MSYIRDVTKLRWHSRGHYRRDKSYRQSFLDVLHYCTSLKFSRDKKWRKWIDRSTSVICCAYLYGEGQREGKKKKKRTEQEQMHRRISKRKWTEIVKVKIRQRQLVVCNVFSCDRKDDRKDLLSSGVIYLRGRFRGGEGGGGKPTKWKELFQVKTAFFLRLTLTATNFREYIRSPPWNEDLYQCVFAKSSSSYCSIPHKTWMYPTILRGEDVGH